MPHWWYRVLTAVGKILISLAMLLVSSPAWAKELYGPEAGVVPFGMGRAYSAVADDGLSLYYNPAGLAMVRKFDFQIFDVRVVTNNDVLGNYSSLSTLGSSGEIASALNDLAGKHIMLKAGNNSQITLPNFALGLLYDVHTHFNMENTANPQTNMRYTKDLGFLAGAAVSAGKNKAFRIGATGKYIRRTGTERSVPISELSGSRSSLKDRFNAEGWGIGGDVGMQWRLPFTARTEITTSFVWHDIGHTSFGGAQDQNKPIRIDQNITAGLGIRFPIQGKQNRRRVRRYGPTRSSSHLSFAFDYSHINYPGSQEDPLKHIHVGMNLDIPILSFQVGLNQTSLTFGTSFDIGIVAVGFATWGEELGNYASQRTDRRYLLTIGSSFGFTP